MSQATRRVVCSIPFDGPCIDNVHFGRVPTDRGELCVSELVTDDAADRLCKIGGFRDLIEGEASASAIDAAIDAARAANTNPASSQDKQTIDELILCNQAQSQELKALRQQLKDAVAGDSSALQAELEKQALALADKDRLIEELQGQIQALTVGAAEAKKAKPAPGKGAAPTPTNQ